MGWDARRIHPVVGDLAKPRLGLSAAQVRSLSGKVQHFFHLAAIYDLTADAESQRVANIEGTRHAIELASAIKAGCFHHTSRSEEHTSELQSLMRISYAVFCLKKKQY